ncbi:hypothetical protein LCGC14_1112490 [marine sediment metagenome]|uniref:AAA+ ATPase domain-containing protein n=1 Tax=marine sediment metagenome TaxID=412755 RepID=A0A0F9MU79_9ZZZZ
MPKLSEIEIGPKKILLYGEPGCGKTAFALTLGEKALYADFDQGLQTGTTLQDKFTKDRGNVEVVTFYNTNPNLVESYSRFKQFVIKLCNECRAGNVKQKVLVIDSLTSMIDASMYTILSNSGHLEKPPTISEYGLRHTDILNVFRILKATNIHVIYLAHVFVYMEGGLNQAEQLKRRIFIQGAKLEPNITTYFDEIWYMQSKEGGSKRSIKTLNTGALLARTRSNLPKEVDTDDISLVELFEKLNVEL